MKNPYLLHIFNATKNVSPFDVNMAYEAAFDGVIPYSEVALEDIYSLTQDTIFSRGKSRFKYTAIFIGGRDFGLAIDMLKHAKSAMMPPFEISIFADPSGAITTAASLLVCVEKQLKEKHNETLKGKRIDIIGGTGPVGICTGVLASQLGAKVYLASSRSKRVAVEHAIEYSKRFDVKLEGLDVSTEKSMLEIISQSDIIIAAAKAGIQVVSKKHLSQAKNLLVAADINAVKPLGIEGVDLHDMGTVIENTPKKALGIGALSIGDLKYKIHLEIFRQMKISSSALYFDHNESFKIARKCAEAL